MKAIRRFLLLATFAAIGLGLAVWVVLLTGAGQSRVQTTQPHGMAATEATSNPAPQSRRDSDVLQAAKTAFTPAPLHPLVAVNRSIADLPSAPLPPRPGELFAPERGPLQPTLLARAADPIGSAEQVPVPPLPGIPGPEPVAPRGSLRGPLPPNPPGSQPGGQPAARGPQPIVKVEAQDTGKLKIHIQNADLREVLDLLGEQGKLNILAGKEVQGKVSVSLEGVDIESALDAVLKTTGYAMRRQGKFIFVGTPEQFNSLEQSLDRVATRVYRPNYITSAELKTLIQPLLTEKTGMVSVSSAAEAGIAANDSNAGGDKYAGGDVVIVRDYQAVLNQIDQVVAEVDVRPMQVSIEAMIMSVQLNDTCKFGVDFVLLQKYMTFGWGSPATSLSNLSLQGGLQFGYLDGNVGAFVQALETIADTDVIAKPRVMVLNKNRAEILIGSKQGYISTTVTETSSTQTVDFLQTGVQLRLRPFISRDGIIRMEIHPELSDGNVTVNGSVTLPNETVTEVTSNVMVHDGCTVVIGGLLRDEKSVSTQQIPFFGSLPYVGFLFRDKTETIGREELIVLLTPRIVYEPGTCAEGKHDQCLFENRHDVYADTEMSPLGRRSIARRYIDLAHSRYEQGDRDTALRFAELAVHFDPQNNEAITLRDAIAHGQPAAPVAGAAYIGGTVPAPPVAPMPGGPEVSDWMLDDLKRDGPPSAIAMPLHPYDPGQPGTSRDIVRPRQLP